MPKLRMIWSGENVLVSKLVSDHTKSVRRKFFLDNSDEEKTNGEQDTLHSVIKRSESSEFYVLPRSNDNPKCEYQQATEVRLHMTHAQSAESSSPTKKKEISPKRDCVVGSSNINSMRKFWNILSLRKLLTTASCPDSEPQSTSGAVTSPPNNLLQRSVTALPIRELRNSAGSSNESLIYISNTTAPSRRLLIPLVEMQSTLQEMNQRMMSGLSVSENEWVQLRQKSIDLGQLFNDQVHFQWEQHSSSSETKSKLFCSSVDLENQIQSKQKSLDILNESDLEDDGENDFDASNHRVRLQGSRLEL